jgi:hypothetical protein
MCFQGKKTPKCNRPHQMKLFNIKINYFGGYNLPERPFSLSRPEFIDSVPLLPIEKAKKIK